MTAVQRDLLQLLVNDLLERMAEDGLLNPQELAAAKKLVPVKLQKRHIHKNPHLDSSKWGR